MSLILIDLQLTKAIYALPHNIYTDSFFAFMSAVGNYAFVWIVIAGVLLLFEEHRNKRFLVPFIVAIVLTSILTSVVLKPMFSRQRPLSDGKTSGVKEVQTPEVEEERPTPTDSTRSYPSDPSFPSGHASVSFAAATTFAYFDKKRRWAFYIVAVLIAFSRVYLGYHYVGDVIGGALLGWTVATILLKTKSTAAPESS